MLLRFVKTTDQEKLNNKFSDKKNATRCGVFYLALT